MPNNGESTALNTYSMTDRFINYNEIMNDESTSSFNLSPRFHLCNLLVDQDKPGCIMAFNADREKEIYLGASYPFS